MHAGIVVYENINRQSGGFLYDRKVVEYLRNRGHQVTVFTQPERRYLARSVDNLNPKFWCQLRRSSLDVLLQDELNHCSLAAGNRWLQKRADYPIVSIVHHLRSSEDHPPEWTRLYRWIERQYLQTVDAFVFNSPSTRRAVWSLIEPRDSVLARPSGRRFGEPISSERITARAHQPGPLQILFIGNVIPRKNLHILIRGLSNVDREQWELHAVGDLTLDEDYAARVRRAVSEGDLDGHVQLHGAVSDPHLRALLERSHVLAVPSTYEGYGIVYVEGMGHGLPSIATPNGGPVDLIEDGVTGFLVEPPVDEAIADHVRTLGRDRDTLATMGLSAREAYLGFPTWKDTGRTVADFLEHLTGS